MYLVLIVLLVLLALGLLPPVGLHGLGYGPSGVLLLILVVLVILLLAGRL